MNIRISVLDLYLVCVCECVCVFMYMCIACGSVYDVYDINFNKLFVQHISKLQKHFYTTVEVVIYMIFHLLKLSRLWLILKTLYFINIFTPKSRGERFLEHNSLSHAVY